MMQQGGQKRRWIIWLAGFIFIVLVFVDVDTYRNQHAHYVYLDRRSDSKVLAQALRALLRDQPTIVADWPETFVIGDKEGVFYCRALDQEIPVRKLRATLFPYLRLMPTDRVINIPSVSLYYLHHRDNHWYVGNCALQVTEEEEV